MRQLAEAVQAPAGKLLIKESTPVYAAPSLDSQQIRRVEKLPGQQGLAAWSPCG
ncbi:MAG: hypothetical protein ACUVSK_05565 [Desulfotomaculales bacterium]